MRHRPAGSGHPYRIDPDQRHPVQLVAGAPFELRVLADRAVPSIDVEFADGALVALQPVVIDELYPPGGGGEGHLAAGSGARPDVGDQTVWRTAAVAPAGGTVRYRFVAGDCSTAWFAAPVGEWRGEGGTLHIAGEGGRVVPGSVEWLVADDGPRRVRLALALADDAHVVGFGERFDHLDQRGRAPDTVVFEQYKDQGNRTYLPSPFALVTGGDPWGFHVRTPRRVWFDVGGSVPDRLLIETTVDPDDPRLSLRLYSGEPAVVLGEHVAEVGGLRRPPDWVFQPWMSANNWNTQARVVEEVERSRELGVPVGVVVIEAWSDESTFTVFRDARYRVSPTGEPLTLAEITHPVDGAWPDPVAMVDHLHELGVRVLLWQIPIAPVDRGDDGQVAADVATMTARGYCVAEADGSPYRNRGWWFPGGLLPDWTNPEAAAWWLAKRRYLVAEVGIDGFKTDGGEHAWGDELRYADGTRGAESNNLFAQRYADAYTSLFDECGVEATTFSRAGYTGAGTAPCHWAGDQSSTWESFRAAITAGLTAGASGVAFWGWDLAGFSGPLPSVELYVRSAAMAALCPIMQYHAEFDAGDVAVGGEASGVADPTTAGERLRRRDRTPWNVAEQHDDELALTLYRRFAVLRQRLVPYLVEQADRSVASGLPMMRALALGFPADAAVWSYPFQYQLGDDLLVAPVCHEGARTIAVYLPRGSWVDAWTGERWDGPQLIERVVPWDEIAVFARAGRAGALVPLFAGLPDPLAARAEVGEH
jgi:alpha-glucosidase (family GH31 glycosyl hydrolase)